MKNLAQARDKRHQKGTTPRWPGQWSEYLQCNIRSRGRNPRGHVRVSRILSTANVKYLPTVFDTGFTHDNCARRVGAFSVLAVFCIHLFYVLRLTSSFTSDSRFPVVLCSTFHCPASDEVQFAAPTAAPPHFQPQARNVTYWSLVKPLAA